MTDLAFQAPYIGLLFQVSRAAGSTRQSYLPQGQGAFE
jgi:hypothetical protein